MKKKFKGKVYRDAIKKLDASNGFACPALIKACETGLYVSRFSKFFTGHGMFWTFATHMMNGGEDRNYRSDTELGRRTREIALELAAHLEDIGEIDRILEEK